MKAYIPDVPATDASDAEKTAWLDQARVAIDALDSDILTLLNRRAGYSIAVGRFKAGSGAPIFRPGREQALMEKLLSANPGPLPAEHLRAVYREILSSSRALQLPLRIAYLGPEGTFSHMATLEYFGESLIYQPKGHLADIFEAVGNGACELGVIPLENSLNGAVGQSLDLFATHDVHVQAEWFSRIRHSLMSRERSLAAIKTVYSHPQALGQCAAWLRQHLPNARQLSLESTAAAAHRALEEPGSAAIGHAGIAPRLGLAVLEQGIEDQSDNWTRFFAIGPTPVDTQDADTSSLLFSLADKPGSLAAVLRCFAEAGINMSKLESRPMRGERWKYIFFVDLDCNISSPAHLATLERVREHCHSLRILGAYCSGKH